MALTFTNTQVLYRGPFTEVYTEATFDSAYAAGGETVNATDLGLVTIKAVSVTDTEGYNATYSKTNASTGKLAVYSTLDPSTNSATAAPVDASVGRNLSAITVTLIVWGQ